MKSALIIPGGGQGMDYPPTPDTDPSGGQSGDATPAGCVNVPLASLATPDDSEQMQTPAVGDSGTMQVDYEVVSITGDQACVQPSAINGKPLDGSDTTTPDDEGDGGNEGAGPDDEGDDLRAQAQSMTPQ